MAHTHRSDILFAAAVGILLAAAWYLRDVLILIYLAALFAVVVGPAITVIERMRIGSWHPSRGVAVILLLATIFAAFGTLFFLILPPIVRDVQAFSRDLPNKIQIVQQKLETLPFGHSISPDSIEQYVAGGVGGAVGIFRGIAGRVLTFFSWLILTAYFIIDGERACRWGLSLLPFEDRSRLRNTLERAETRVSRWLLGQAMLMIILGVSAGVTFSLLGVKYAFALGVFAGIANIVPIIGPVLSASLAASVAAVDSLGKFLGVLIFYVVYQQVENAFLTPRIMKSTVDLPALGVVIALAIGGKLAGPVGAVFAVPTAALIAVLVDEYLVHRPLHAAAEE